MSIKIRPFKGQEGVWEVDIIVQMPNGQRLRERKRAPVSSKSAALRWGQERERHLIRHGDERPTAKANTQPAERGDRERLPRSAGRVMRAHRASAGCPSDDRPARSCAFRFHDPLPSPVRQPSWRRAGQGLPREAWYTRGRIDVARES